MGFSLLSRKNKQLSAKLLPMRGVVTWPLADAAVDFVDARRCLQSLLKRLGQITAKSSVTRFVGEPLEEGVGEGRHVFPAPIRHVDFPQSNPWGQSFELEIKEDGRFNTQFYRYRY